MEQINAEDLRRMNGREGLIIQGCGGDLQEWIDGINQVLTDEGILQDGNRLEDVATFQHEGVTNLLFFFGEEKLDIGKLAIWRLQTHSMFGGTWLSDYVDNRLGGFSHEAAQEKPDCPLIGEDGNVFNLIGIASRTLKEHGLYEQAEEMANHIFDDCHSYEEALAVIGEYVTITSREEQQGMDGMSM